jgi:hypothetical protein
MYATVKQVQARLDSDIDLLDDEQVEQKLSELNAGRR